MDCFISLGYVQICIQPHQHPGAIWNPFGYTWSQSLPQEGCSEVSVHLQCSEVILRGRQLSLLPFALWITHALGWSPPSPPPQGNLFLRVAEYGLRIQPFHVKKNPLHVHHWHYPEHHAAEEENSLTPFINMAAFSSSGILMLCVIPGNLYTFCWFIPTLWFSKWVSINRSYDAFKKFQAPPPEFLIVWAKVCSLIQLPRWTLDYVSENTLSRVLKNKKSCPELTGRRLRAWL